MALLVTQFIAAHRIYPIRQDGQLSKLAITCQSINNQSIIHSFCFLLLHVLCYYRGNYVVSSPFTATRTTADLAFFVESLSSQQDALLFDTVSVALYQPGSSTAGGNGPNPGRASSSSSSTASPRAEDTSSSSSSLSGGAIAGIVIGVISAVACIAVALFFLCCGGASGASKWQRHNDKDVEVSQNAGGESSRTHDHAETDEVELA